MNAASLIQREIAADRIYTAADIDRPGSPGVAVAWKACDGWRVTVPGGEVIASRLDKRHALSLMRTTAIRLLDRAATYAVISGGTQ